MTNKKIKSPSFSFKGWDLGEFIRGRKKLLVTIIGGVAGFIATQSPVYAGLVGALAELLYAIIEYYVKKK